MTRDENGKFVKGHPNVGAGRKPKATELRVLELFKAAITDEDVTRIVKKAVELASNGDTAARKFLFDYLVGPPVEKHELTGMDGGPLVIKVRLKANA